MTWMIFILLFIFQTKHLLADYFLQGEYMLGKFKEKGWILPLSAHCFVHFIFTASIAFVCTSNVGIAIGLGILDFVFHFFIDRMKVNASRGIGHYEPRFWWYLGIDQYCHHLVHYLIISLILL